MALTKATARTLQVACYYPVYLVVVTDCIYRLSRSGSPANLTSSPTIFLTYLHIYIGRACMGPWQQSLQRLEAKIAMKSNSQYIISVNKQYVQHTNSYGGRAYPPSYDSLAIFLAHFADTHAGSSKSIANILSAIRVFCYYSHQPWLPADQLYRLSLVRKEIRLEDAKPINRKLPIKRELIQRGLAQHWKVTESACDLLVATITLFGHNGILRGDEIFSKLRVGDVTWDRGSAIRSFKVHIGRPDQLGKTAKDGGGFIVHIVDYEVASAYKYLV